MLRIGTVPPAMSHYREETSPTVASGCGRNCLAKCCLSVSRLPLYASKKCLNIDEKINQSETCFLQNLVMSQWEDRMRRGLFRYDVTACETKLVDGEFGFIAQLNEGRHLMKRPTEIVVDQVVQPFDNDKFNFTRIGQEEVLFRFEQGRDRESCFIDDAPVEDGVSPSVVAINVSPIEYGHVLLIPRVLDALPQMIDRESFSLALRFAIELDDPFFRVGYNGLGAFATINHLHFQAYYLTMPFPVEKAPNERISITTKGVILSQLHNYPVRALVFEGGNSTQNLSDRVSDTCISLQDNDIPFNVLISDRGRSVFVFPQYYAEKRAIGEISEDILESQVNPGVWEICGHVVMKHRNGYDNASEEFVMRLLSEVPLSEERFEQMKACALEPNF